MNRCEFAAHAYILPHMEQGNVFKLIDFSVSYNPAHPTGTPAGNVTAAGAKIKSFVCPSDPNSSFPAAWAPTNYR